MATISVKIDESKAARLRQKAKRLGLNPEQLVTASIEDLISNPNPEFEEAMRRVISKNRKLYERLA